MPIEIVELKTHEPEVANEAIDALYSPDKGISISGPKENYSCELRFASTRDLGVDRLRHTMHARGVLPMGDLFVAVSMLGGSFSHFAADGEERRLSRGDVARYPINGELTARWEDVEVAAVRMPMSVLRRVADERTDVAGATLRFESLTPISPEAARGWRHLTRFLNREVSADGGLLDNPLLELELTELAAATALTTFPNSTIRDTARNRHTTAPAAVRRAVAYIEANAGQPITITDIAREAGVTPRSVQYGFARHLDMTPMAYLQRIRLTHAHHDLKAADPMDGTTVAAVARRWGFAKPGRFAGEYRAVYGQPPSLTLRS